MSINTDTTVKRIPLVPALDLHERIRKECEIQSSLDAARRLVAAFEAHNQVILIFQAASA